MLLGSFRGKENIKKKKKIKQTKKQYINTHMMHNPVSISISVWKNASKFKFRLFSAT